MTQTGTHQDAPGGYGSSTSAVARAAPPRCTCGRTRSLPSPT